MLSSAYTDTKLWEAREIKDPQRLGKSGNTNVYIYMDGFCQGTFFNCPNSYKDPPSWMEDVGDYPKDPIVGY